MPTLRFPRLDDLTADERAVHDLAIDASRPNDLFFTVTNAVRVIDLATRTVVQKLDVPAPHGIVAIGIP